MRVYEANIKLIPKNNKVSIKKKKKKEITDQYPS